MKSMRFPHCGSAGLKTAYDGTVTCLSCGRAVPVCEGCGAVLARAVASEPWCDRRCKGVALSQRRSRRISREVDQGVG